MNCQLIKQAFHPVEAAIARIALGLPAERGDKKYDLWNLDKSLHSGVVHLEQGFNESGRRRSASDALARMVLSGVEDTLPVYIAVSRGVTIVTRKQRAPRIPSVRAVPIFLLEVNWANSAPGISWPEAHHVGWLPDFDRWVLTSSRGTPELDGYCDRVLCHFDQCGDPAAEAGSRIQAYWQGLKDAYGQARWACLLSTGRINESDAARMASTVWPVIAQEHGTAREAGA
jgi:hypothetical protein